MHFNCRPVGSRALAGVVQYLAGPYSLCPIQPFYEVMCISGEVTRSFLACLVTHSHTIPAAPPMRYSHGFTCRTDAIRFALDRSSATGSEPLVSKVVERTTAVLQGGGKGRDDYSVLVRRKGCKTRTKASQRLHRLLCKSEDPLSRNSSHHTWFVFVAGICTCALHAV